MEDKQGLFQIRTITTNTATYARVEDVADYLLEIAASEETDTRRRLEQASKNIQRLNRNKELQ